MAFQQYCFFQLQHNVFRDGKEITLAVIQVGNDEASTVYVGNKKKACEYIGIHSLSYELSEETTILLLPITTQCFPAISIPDRFKSCIIPAGVQETNPDSPMLNAPTFCGWKPNCVESISL